MWCGRFRITLSLLNVVCPPFRTTTLVDNETTEGQIGEGCGVGSWAHLHVLEVINVFKTGTLFSAQIS